VKYRVNLLTKKGHTIVGPVDVVAISENAIVVGVDEEHIETVALEAIESFNLEILRGEDDETLPF